MKHPSLFFEMDPEKGVCRIEGISYPMIGFGTWPLKGEVCTTAVKNAVNTGYRLIDTATMYNNFEAIAKAFQGLDRRKFYITSKVWHDKQNPGDLRRDLETTLEKLEMDFIDGYLIHWPNSRVPIEETLGAMDGLRKAKKVRHIGLSNGSVNHLKKALQVGVPMQWVQVEMHPDFCDFELLSFCKQHLISIQAWRPLGKGRLKDDPMLSEIGRKYGKTACQISLRWLIEEGCIPLPGSSRKEHAQENFDVFDFSLTPKEIKAISQRASMGTRMRGTVENVGFNDEFDFSYDQCWPKRVSIK